MTVVVSGPRAQGEPSAPPYPPLRGLVDGLPSPRPIGKEVPSAFQEDDFCQRMVTAFDDALAPIFNVLDCFDSYLDARLTPPDFLDWLGSWVGVDIDETWSLERRRKLVEQAVVLYRIRGTAAGLAAHIRLYCGVTPEIVDNGGCSWSQTADSPIPGSPEPRLKVRLPVDDPEAVRRTTVSRIVDAARPAHIPYELEILVGGKQVQAVAQEVDPDMADANAPGAVALPGSETIELAPQSPAAEDEEEQAQAVTEAETAGETSGPDGEPTG